MSLTHALADVYIHNSIHIYTNIFMLLYTCLCTHARIYKYIDTSVCIYVQIHIDVYKKAESRLLAPKAQTPGKTKSLEQIWSHSACNATSGTGLYP